jgi:hypothetical protein
VLIEARHPLVGPGSPSLRAGSTRKVVAGCCLQERNSSRADAALGGRVAGD